MNTTGWNLQGGARVTNVIGTGDSELLLCPLHSPSGAVFFNQPINLSLCNKWKAEFDYRMYDGTGADGIAFCFLDVPPAGFVAGGGLGIPSTANGLKICFDTWNNCIPFDTGTVHQDMPKVEIRWGAGYNECSNQPTRDNADGKISFVRSPNYNHVLVTYDNGNIQVFVNDSLFVTGYQQFNFNGYLGFTASTGGYTDNHSIKNVVIYTQMPPSIAGNPASACPGGTIQLGGPTDSTYSYQWYPSAGLSQTNIAAPVLTVANSTDSSQLYKYYVRTAYGSNPGCASIDSVTVRAFPNPKVNFITPEICLTDAVARFTDSSYTADSTTLPFTFLWNFGDPASGPGNPDTSKLQNPSHRYSAAAHYQVSLMAKNNAGCVDSLTRIFTVNGAVPKAEFTIKDSLGLCSNKVLQLVNESTVNFGSITRIQILWGDSSGAWTTDPTPFLGKIYSHNYPNPISASSKPYTITMIASSGISCQQTLSQEITVNPAPHIQINPIHSLCDNSPSINIKQSAIVPLLQGVFSYGGAGVDSFGGFHPGISGPGMDTVYYRFQAEDHCVDSGSQVIQVFASPIVNPGPDHYVSLGDSVTLFATATGNSLQYLWYPSNFLNSPSVLTPVCTPFSSVLYTLYVKGVGGCTNSGQVWVKLLPSPLIPNAFSPNGDGINDKWEIRNLNLYPNCDVRIFNRYGQMVFHSVGYQNPWDGTYNGQPAPVGVYVFLIETKKQKRPISGTVTLLR